MCKAIACFSHRIKSLKPADSIREVTNYSIFLVVYNRNITYIVKAVSVAYNFLVCFHSIITLCISG